MQDLHDSLSNVLGWISIACWVVVYTPQIYENYALQSGEGLSVLFVIVWLLGDLFNLVGSVLGRLIPTVSILASYYTTCDMILLSQIYYYRWKRYRRPLDPLERLPLLHETYHEPIGKKLLLRYTGALVFVVAVGSLVWWFDGSTESREPTPPQKLHWEVLVLGWTSAVFYLSSRLPQIYKNFKTRCEGLSPALFFFAIFGNLTFALSICAKSFDRNYLIKNAGWLAGSALTVFMDAFVLCQIFYYRATDTLSQ